MRLLLLAPLLLPSALAACSSASSGAFVEGVVRSASGEVLQGAQVALIPTDVHFDPFTAPPAARGESTAGGAFRLGPVPDGRYGVSITAPGHTTSYQGDVVLARGSPVRGMDVVLGTDGSLLQGTVRRGEEPVANAWVSLIRLRTRDTQPGVAYVRTDARGMWAALLPPGAYAVTSTAPGYRSAPEQVRLGGPRTLDLDSAPVDTQPPDEVRTWLRQAAVPLSTVEAGHGFADLQPLSGWLARARVVALGEATHGTREFFQLKHRILEFLVREHGFTVFAIEAEFADALALNEYVLTGSGNPAELLASLRFWTWETEEVLALIQWMRAYNADPAHPQKLKFYGFDSQASVGSARALRSYLQQVDAAYAPHAQEALGGLRDDSIVMTPGPPVETLQGYALALAEVRARLNGQRDAYVRRSSARRWAEAVRHVDLLSGLVEVASFGDAKEYAHRVTRDQAMADNVRWLLEQEGPESRMVVWAHNGHVSTARSRGVLPMGHYLRAALGDSFYVFGFFFNQGAFRAMHRPPEGFSRGLIAHTVPSARPGTLDAVLASVGLPRFALDLRGAPRGGPVGAFLGERRLSRQIGALYWESFPDTPLRAAASFDGLLFVDRSTAAIETQAGPAH